MAGEKRTSVKRKLLGFFVALAVVLIAGWLGIDLSGEGRSRPGAGVASPEAPQQSQVDRAGTPEVLRSCIEQRLSGVMVTLRAELVKVLPDDNDGSRHQRLLLVLPEPVGDTTTVLIAHNIDLAPRVPCDEGDTLVVRGQYEWNDRGGVIHWTHHDPAQRREGGWIEHAGRRYE